MVKRILLSIVMLMLIAYLGIAITAFNRKPADQTCRDVELVIKDTTYAGFITKEEVKGILQHKGIYPIGKKMERISTKSLERELSKHPLIDAAGGSVEDAIAMERRKLAPLKERADYCIDTTFLSNAQLKDTVAKEP